MRIDLRRVYDAEADRIARAYAASVQRQMLGVELVEAAEGRAVTRMAVSPEHLAPNGYLHAAAVIAAADMACGFGCMASLPDGRTGFTTIELKSNFVGTVRDGVIEADAVRLHGGRTTQVWDATVRAAEGATIAHFRCTQLLLAPRGGA